MKCTGTVDFFNYFMWMLERIDAKIILHLLGSRIFHAATFHASILADMLHALGILSLTRALMGLWIFHHLMGGG